MYAHVLVVVVIVTCTIALVLPKKRSVVSVEPEKLREQKKKRVAPVQDVVHPNEEINNDIRSIKEKSERQRANFGEDGELAHMLWGN